MERCAPSPGRYRVRPLPKGPKGEVEVKTLPPGEVASYRAGEGAPHSIGAMIIPGATMYDRIQRARKLRRTMTEQEQLVWTKLRGRRFHEFKFRRQVPMGPYVADFVCLKEWLIIELDGGQHNETKAKDDDQERDLWFKNQGFRVLRFWNHEMTEDWDAVEEIIWRALHRE